MNSVRNMGEAQGVRKLLKLPVTNREIGNSPFLLAHYSFYRIINCKTASLPSQTSQSSVYLMNVYE